MVIKKGLTILLLLMPLVLGLTTESYTTIFDETTAKIGNESEKDVEVSNGGHIDRTDLEETIIYQTLQLVNTHFEEVKKEGLGDFYEQLDKISRKLEKKRTGIPYEFRVCFPPENCVLFERDTQEETWLIVQRRGVTGRPNWERDFYRNWNEYENGFGTLAGDFWIGLSNLHEVTSTGEYVLMIELEDWKSSKVYAIYDTFYIGRPSDGYKLYVGGYNGTAGNSLSYHNGKSFSTYDADGDDYDGNCAQERKGAWWFGECLSSHLNGVYYNKNSKGKIHNDYSGIVWSGWKGSEYSLKASRMKIRRKSLAEETGESPLKTYFASRESLIQNSSLEECRTAKDSEKCALARSPTGCWESGLSHYPNTEWTSFIQLQGKDEDKMVLCRNTFQSNGWTVIQRRGVDGRNASERKFDKDWTEFEQGFGPLDGDFWIGLESLYAMTGTKNHQIHISLEDWEGNKKYAEYKTFSVGPPSEKFKLTVGGYSGTAGDSMLSSSGRYFSTKDKDNDATSYRHCASDKLGSWWYGDCYQRNSESNLNGWYYPTSTITGNDGSGIIWAGWKGNSYSLKATEIMIRPSVS